MIGSATESSGWRTSVRHAPALRWMGHRLSFALGMPVLTLVGAATSLVVPRLVDPAQFGAYALLLNLFRYAGRGDLGLSQLADQRIAARPGVVDELEVLDLWQCRILLGLASFLALLPLAILWASWSGWVTPLDAALATAAGSASMMAGGPSSIFRARGWIWEYTALGFFFCIGFVVPRILGFLLDGVTGCFLALLFWYGAVVVFFQSAWPSWRRFHVLSGRLRANIAASFPLFAFSAAWTIYLSANRWIAAGLSTPYDLGLFAIGANLALTGVTMLIGIADLRYPHWLGLLAGDRRGDHSDAIAREAMLVAAAVSCAALAFVPLAGPLVRAFFPAYVGSASAAVALSISCIPLAVVAWFLPVAIAMSRRPWLDACVVFGPATIVLIAGMAIGDRLDGIEGQSWGCCASGMAALMGLTVVFVTIGILKPWPAMRLVVTAAVMVLALAGIAKAAGPHGELAMVRGAGTGPLASGPPPNWRVAFQDNFRTMSLWDGTTGRWQATYPWGGHTNPTSNELEYYVDPISDRGNGLIPSFNPFVLDQEGLTITARSVPAASRPATKGFAYASGLLNGLHGFRFTYGYVEMRARLPRGKGLWPAFWLLPVARVWPPEIDVMEMVDGGADRYWVTLHAGAAKAEKVVQAAIDTGDLQAEFHDYAVLWTADEIAWYFDGRRVAATPTLVDLHQPMYLVVNLAVGGEWSGAPDATTIFPARMTIARIRVLQAAEGADR